MARQAGALVRALRGTVEAVVRDVTTVATEELRVITPKDTTFASANWVPSTGRPVIRNLTGVQPTRALAASARSRQQSAVRRVTGYRLGNGRRTYITNNAPYIVPLNSKGTSPQQSAGFVQRGIKKAIGNVSK